MLPMPQATTLLWNRNIIITTQTRYSDTLCHYTVCLQIRNLTSAHTALHMSAGKESHTLIPEWLKWTCCYCSCSNTALCLSQEGLAGSDFTFFYFCDLDIDTWVMTLIYEINLHIPKKYLHTTNKLSKSRISKPDRERDEQMW